MELEWKFSLSLHISIVLFGLAGLFGKLLPFSPISIVFGRVGFAFLFLLFAIIFSKNKRMVLNYNLKTHTFLFLSGFLLIAHWFSFFYAIQKSSVSAGLFMFASFPVFTLLIEKFLLKSKIFKNEIISIFFTVAGLLFISDFLISKNFGFCLVFWGIFSGFSFSLLGILNKNLRIKMNSLEINLFQYAYAFLLIFIYSFFNEQIFIYNNISLKSFLLLFLLGTVFTAVSHSLFIYSLKNISVYKASVFACFEPVYGSIAAFIILQESLSKNILFGGLLILFGGLILNYKKLDIKK